MKNTLFIFLLFSFAVAFAQKEKTSSNLYINVAANYHYRNYTTILYAPQFSPALSLFIRSQPSRMWEVGFSQLYFGKKAITNATAHNLLLGANLTHNWIFLTENKFPIKPVLGAGIYTYFSNYDYQPNTSLTYGLLRRVWGAELGINLGLLYEHNNWLFSLTNPIGFGDAGLVETKDRNPNLSFSESRKIFFNFSPAIGFSCLKLGIARKI